MTDYEKYQLQWMIDHGHSLRELISELSTQQADSPDASVKDLYTDWERDRGFGSEIWACEPEWEECEGSSDTHPCDPKNLMAVEFMIQIGSTERQMVALFNKGRTSYEQVKAMLLDGSFEDCEDIIVAARKQAINVIRGGVPFSD